MSPTAFDLSAIMDLTGQTVAHSLARRSFTAEQIHSVAISERVMSTISILSSLFVLATFMCFSSLRAKVVNRLIFYATWGNLFTNFATLISVSGVQQGPKSGLCQAQGFLIQMFMPADCLWAFCLALNVFLTFHTFRWKINNVRMLEPYYIFFCYGIPLIPALVFLILDTNYGHEIYGNAVIWCWITEEHKVLRMAAFYGPVWVVITWTVIIYSIIGWRIWRDRVRVRKSSSESPCEYTNGTAELKFGGIMVSKELSIQVNPTLPVLSRRISGSGNIEDDTTEDSLSAPVVSVGSHEGPSVGNDSKPQICPVSKQSLGPPDALEEHDVAAPAAQIATTVTATKRLTLQLDAEESSTVLRINTKGMNGAKTYAQVAFMLFVIMCIVWIPSTANRLYAYVDPKATSFGLNLAASIVLPLQGFFNCVIYITTSRRQIHTICHDPWARVRNRRALCNTSPLSIDAEAANRVVGSSPAPVTPSLPQGATQEDLDAFFVAYDRFQRRTGAGPSAAAGSDDDIEQLEKSVGFGSPRFAQMKFSPQRSPTRPKFCRFASSERDLTAECASCEASSETDRTSSEASLDPRHEAEHV